MIGEEVQRYRLRSHITQQRLGELMGFRGATARIVIQQWEQNKRHVPLKHFRRLHELINIPYEKLVP